MTYLQSLAFRMTDAFKLSANLEEKGGEIPYVDVPEQGLLFGPVLWYFTLGLFDDE